MTDVQTHPADPQSSTAGQAPSPRAIVLRMGTFFMGVGTILLLSSCCFWSRSGTALREIESGTTAAWIATAMVVTSLVGGLGLTSCGVGLRGEMRWSGVWAMIVSGTMLAVYAACLTLQWRSSGLGWNLVLPALLTGLSVLLFLGAFASAACLSASPPPLDQSDVRDDLLQRLRTEHKQERPR